jgi:hypothetical protein
MMEVHFLRTLFQAGQGRKREDMKGEVELVPKAKTANHIEPVPRYINPDHSAPDYDAIMEQLQNYQASQIGTSYYYIRADENLCALCRIFSGGGKIFFHEIVNHEKHGISEEDILESVKQDPGLFTLPGHYYISPHIEAKLRALNEN